MVVEDSPAVRGVVSPCRGARGSSGLRALNRTIGSAVVRAASASNRSSLWTCRCSSAQVTVTVSPAWPIPTCMRCPATMMAPRQLTRRCTEGGVSGTCGAVVWVSDRVIRFQPSAAEGARWCAAPTPQRRSPWTRPARRTDVSVFHPWRNSQDQGPRPRTGLVTGWAGLLRRGTRSRSRPGRPGQPVRVCRPPRAQTPCPRHGDRGRRPGYSRSPRRH